MRTATFFSLVPLGLALTTLVPSRAEAQRRQQVIVCRDGTRSYSDDVRACARHRGLDVRATEEARRYDNDRSANGRSDNRRDDRGDNRGDDRRNSGDDRRNGGDDRYGYGTGGRSEVYEWQGTVDKEIQIQLRGNRASVQPIGAGDRRSGRGQVVNGLPQRNGTLVVQRLSGRGDVDVIEQPSSRNGYTATIRIRDPRGGADNYRIAVYFESSSNNDGRYGGYGRN
jgi:hypothetical protein